MGKKLPNADKFKYIGIKDGGYSLIETEYENSGPTSQKRYSVCIIQVSQEEWTKLRESVPYVELYRYNPKHLYPKLNGYGDNGQRILKLFHSCYTLTDYQIHIKTGRNMWFL